MNSQENSKARTRYEDPSNRRDGQRSARLGLTTAVLASAVWACGGGSGTTSPQGPSGNKGSGSSSGGGSGSGSDNGGTGLTSSGGGSSSGSSSSSGGPGGPDGVSDAGGSSSGGGDDASASGDAARASSGCGQTLPPLSDYSQNGPFTAMTVNNSGPNGAYTIVLPTTLGQNGFKHPIATWGNGITTTPATYPTLLNRIASHGIVVIASNDTQVTAAEMTGGLDWMIQQNAAAGSYQGKLDTSCLVAIGYSWGGMGAVNAGSHANIVTTVSFHGLQGASQSLKTPLLLFASTNDTFVSASGYVTPTYNASVVQTFYETTTAAGDPSNEGHLLVIDPKDPEYDVAMAWLRLWVYGDQGARSYFYGPDAKACKSPFSCQTKQAGGMSQMSGF
jgi:Dienelactone hydrolase family